ncbi:hypothetical protein HER10_EVM0011703 [Colletotrichum scovillei]|uniref:uncharacterized protein n=1 Tax=Colletotrichum scovillei TaxID=1209932 RepID=UPI0015C3D378|nr:uncharacterized protein HER10_EVM0011703 [Colletotrichum scovillei]KAF4778011.1 hypothetical protein HER10_EVM0011703 [Colletotrichum scovillei]
MGRWGFRLFEGDEDLDIAAAIRETFGDGPEQLNLPLMINQSDMLAPMEAREFYKTEEHAQVLRGLVTEIRGRLDSGVGDELFKKYRALEHEYQGQYRTIVVGALMMRAGAKIKADDFQHLRDLVPKIPCQYRFAMPIVDFGFRDPGKAQFLAALDNYQPGTPRDFHEPSCFHCGRIRADHGINLKKCGHCQAAWYCGIDCQRAHRKIHKVSCKSLGEKVLINV